MFSKIKSYRFNNYTLQFEEVLPPLRAKIINALRFFLLASLLSIVPIIIMSLTIGSPVEVILKSQISNYTEGYKNLNHDIDNLQYLLQNNVFISDKFYRELLEVDSLPSPIRYAGMGGWEQSFKIFAFPYTSLISTTERKIEVLNKQLEIQQESYNNLLKEAILQRDEFKYIPVISPVKPAAGISISSRFGSRFDPFTFISRTHDGIDFMGPVNTEIFATSDGIVSLADDNATGYGKEIVLLHQFGYSTRYAHLNKILVSSGQKVTRGQLIGLMGSTGRSTGTHLHYEVRLFNRPVNPLNYFADDLTEQEYNMIVEQNLAEENKNHGKTQL